MKFGTMLVFAALLATTLQGERLGETVKATSHVGGISAVVTMLKTMLKESKENWEKDQEAYGEYKKYCDDNEEEKTEAVRDATKKIALLENKIEALQGSNGGLSVKTAELKSDMADNKQARDDAEAAREKENKAFLKAKKGFEDAISTLDDAIKELAAVGADQAAGASAAHEKFMADYKDKEQSLVSIRSSVRKALMDASAFLDPVNQKNIQAFVQAPFTGTYTAQSAQIVGILKDMKLTFQTDLETATADEEKAKEAYDKFKKTKEEEYDDLKKSYDTKQENLGKNDGDLSTKKTQLQTEKKQKGEDEDFLEKLSVACIDKSEAYAKRKKFAMNEQVALSKALAILDNDVASEKFGDAFIQLSAVRHRSNMRSVATMILKNAVHKHYSARLGKVILLLQTGNPFTIVLKQIDKLVTLIDKEQKVDDAEKSWCETTDKEQTKKLDGVKEDLETTGDDIKKLNADIDGPETGLKAQIKENEGKLKKCLKNQADETKERREANLDYQKDARTMSDAIVLITQAETILTDYYDTLDNEQIGLIQEDPAPPKTFTGSYKGQNEQAKEVLKLLDGLKTDTEKESNAAHDTERKAQHDYEDSMEELTKEEASLEESIAKLNKDLADKEKELVAKYEDQESQEREKIAIERYMEKIKPGCDFITGKYDDRKTARKAEKEALKTAKTSLENSPNYKLAKQQAEEAAMGKCKETCLADEADVKCKACLAGVSEPGYCAGHKGTKGCDKKGDSGF